MVVNMETLFNHQRWLLFSAITALLTSLAACGGSTGGGAAPTGSGGTPVAVEIPALGEVSGLPFTTGVVVTGSSALSAPIKSMGGMNKTIGTTGNPFEIGDSYVACETTNQWRHLLDASTQSDQGLCILQDNTTTASNAGVDLYDGNYHIFSTLVASGDSLVAIKFKTRITVNSSDIINGYEMFVCSDGVQSSYISYTISNTDITAITKNLDGTELNAMTLTGVLDSSDPTQYTTKTVAFEYVVDYANPDIDGGGGTMTQAPSTVLMNSFDYRSGDGPRIYSSVDLTNPSGTPFDPREYELGSGAGTAITPEFTVTECWDGTSLMPVTCLDSNSNYVAIQGKTPVAITYPSISQFSGSNAWDCSGTSEFTVPDPLTTGGSESCLARFTINGDHIDCDALETTFDLSASYNGSTLSTSSGSPTSVSSTPTIVLNLNRTGDRTTFDSESVELSDLTAFLGVRLDFSNWNSDFTTLTLSPTLTSGNTYRLTISGGNAGAMAGSGYDKIMSGQRIYYFTAN